MNIKCHYGLGIELIKEQAELFNIAIVAFADYVKQMWEVIKEMSMAIFEGFQEVIYESKKLNYPIRSYFLESQVIDRRPSFVRIRNNC
ncbi:hypothetical protein [Peribacillus muralis]|uniref:hypothetical protein n=1 Tax=Peribacillus muralis TaxID=264697 RepID=UPI003D01D304